MPARDDRFAGPAGAGTPAALPLVSPRAALVRLLCGLAALFGLVLLARLLGADAFLATLAARARGMGAAGVALHALAYVPAALLGLPLVPLTMAAGLAWGTLAGAAVAVPATAVSSSLAFLLGRRLLARHPEALARGDGRVARLARAFGATGFRTVLLLRLFPVTPFGVLNYALGASRCRLRDFALATALGTVPGALAYAAAGALLGGP
jgi:uncharacterized membrane protein YdjX (TVP38/TMEM64 family)